MKKTNFSKYAILGLLLAGMAALTALTVKAQQALVSADITIGQTLTAETVAPLLFGNFSAPTLGPVEVTVAPFGALTITPPGDLLQLGGPPFPTGGEVLVLGPAFPSYSIQTSVDTDFSAANLSIQDVVTNPPAGAGTGFLDPGGVSTIFIGATAVVSPGVGTGPNGGGGPASITIDINLP